MTRRTGQSMRPKPTDDGAHAFAEHSSGKRISTDNVIVNSLRQQYPELQVIVAPATSCQLLAYAGSGHAIATPLEDPEDPESLPLTWRRWMPPARRMGGGAGVLLDEVQFAKFMYKWKKQEFLLYVVSGRDGSGFYPQLPNNYILGTDENFISQLIVDCSRWTYQLHDEIWVFDQGYWQKSAELWQSIQGSEWDNVILDEDMKQGIKDDVNDFFESPATYQRLQVPWKRGLIFHGPPGNGKTISIKTIMHNLYRREDPVPTLYVRSLAGFAGPEFSLKMIFSRARTEAPCFLVFEDLDSIVTDRVRSYFLNEVDGIKGNDGILMVGSTNHLDQLDPGLSKRPSRFDRKYLFPDPSLPQRVAYAKFWQHKLSSTPDIKFPDEICTAVAGITQDFSFAYMQEAFVASLLAIARRSGEDQTLIKEPVNNENDAEPESPDQELGPHEAARQYKQVMKKLQEQSKRYADILAKLEKKGIALDGDDNSDLDDLPLWQELKKQIAILREGLEDSIGSRPIAAPSQPRVIAADQPPPPPQMGSFLPVGALGTKQPHQERITQWLQSLDITGGPALEGPMLGSKGL